MKKTYDVIVVGGGAMGIAATYQLAKKGKSVLCIDQSTIPNRFGSTHGDTRITRQAIGEGSAYVPLTLRSYQIWREIEERTKYDLLSITGGLVMSSDSTDVLAHGNPNFLKETINTASKYRIPYKILNAKQISEQFPQFNLVGDEMGYYEYGAGFLRPENCVSAQLHLAEKSGAEIKINTKVTDIKPLPGGEGATVETDSGNFSTNKVIVSAGAWVSRFLNKKAGDLFTIQKQVLYWFDVKHSIKPFRRGSFPVFIYMGRNNFIYGFPAINGLNGGVKIATETENIVANPDSVDREVTQDAMNEMYKTYVEDLLPGLSPRCLRAVSCLYTKTLDSNFVIDRHPDYPQVIVASPCSGHGFKHSAAIGEVLAQLVVSGRSEIDISSFSFSRFST